MLRAIKPMSKMPSSGTVNPTAKLMTSPKSGGSPVKGLSCLGNRVRNRATQNAIVIVSQMVVARGITTSKPAMRSFFKSCRNF